jgi:hypothetical protein
MRNILIIVFAFITINIQSQADPVFRSINISVANEAEMLAIPSGKVSDGQTCYREDTRTLWIYDSSQWNDSGVGADGGGGGGSSLTDAEISQAFLNENPNTDLDSTNDFDGAWGSITGIPADIADGDTDTQLTDAQVATAATNEGFVTGNHTIDTNTQLSDGEITALGYIKTDTNTQLSDGEIGAFGYIKTDTDTQLTDAEVSTAFINENPNVDLDSSNDFSGDFTALTNIPSGLADGDDNTNDFTTGGTVSGSNLTLTIPNQTSPVINLSPFLLQVNSVLVKVDEGNGDGYVKSGRNSIFYGNVGLQALDFSTSTSSSSIKGATGSYAFANGQNTTASGLGSFANGNDSNADANYAFANGNNAVATGIYSFAHGFDVTASGTGTVAMGESGVVASGNGSFAHGATSVASGGLSMVRGLGLNAPSFAETTLGIYGTTYSAADANSFVSFDRLFSIGNGASSGSRSDAMVVLKDGTVTFPSLDISEIVNAKSPITKEYADANYSGGGGTTQDLSISGTAISITGGTGIDIASAIAAGDTDTQLNETQVDAFVGNNDYVVSGTAPVLDATNFTNLPSGSMTTDQINRLANVGQEVFETLTDNYSTIATDFQKTTGTDIGKRTVKVHDATTDFTVTITDAIADGQSNQFLNRNANGSITLVPDTGIIFNKKSGYNAVANDSTRVAFIRHSATDFELIGNFSWVAQSSGNPNLWTTSNALNPDNEANTSTDWSTNDAAITIATSATANNGNYSLSISQTATGLNTDVQAQTGFWGTGTFPAGTYDLTFDVLVPSGANNVQVNFSNGNNGTVFNTANRSFDGNAAWQSGNISFTLDGTENIYFYIRMSTDVDNFTAIGSFEVLLDNLTLKVQ